MKSKKTAHIVALFAAAVCALTAFAVLTACKPKGHVHEYGEWVTVREATCTEDGERERACTVCGEKQTEAIAATGHKSDVWLSDGDYHYKVCDVCGETFDRGEHSYTDGACAVCGEEEPAEQILNFELVEGGGAYAVTGGTVKGALEIPAEYEGLPVTQIAATSFKGAEITSLQIPSSVTSIGDQAFAQCYSLTEVTLPETVTELGNYIFWKSGLQSAEVNCNTALGTFYECSSLTEVTFGENVTELAKYAFYKCTSLESIEINCNAGYGVFYECSSLSAVTFGENVTELGEYVFYKCTSLKSIVLPVGLQKCGKYAFRASGLETITVNGDMLGGVPLDTLYAFYECTALATAIFTANASRYSFYAFDNCGTLERYVLDDGYPYYKSIDGIIYNNSLTTCVKAPHGISGEITLPESVTKISEVAFQKCVNLTKVNLPSSLETIASSAFAGSGLTGVSVPDNVTTISDAAFKDCSALSSVHIGAGVASVTGYAFAGDVIAQLTVSPQNAKYKAVNNCLVSVTGSLIYSNAACEIPSGITEIGSYAFRGRELTSITIPEGITAIWRGAFQDCANLKSISLPSTLRTIDSYCFSGCSSLETITFPSSLNTIGMRAFENCGSLTSAVFANTTGWKVTANGASSSSAVSVVVTDAAQNAEYLVNTYYKYKWSNT